ncbi:cytochrome P450, family 704, subfamily A, polypeptide 2 [Hibiscus trionum]|uniref:Cytochrome P450, family 704, subfamily A, polypeptide 2 n=1 Tax=Hibiscus trionum TaxID=183268 RepID=A0A9W7MC54_HIBTR|nr:cytochrome P450, family 704, subfamily A, polypeptide 2 [Hibiscus trionum]
MDIPTIIFSLIAFPFSFVLIILSVFVIKIFTGKSIGDPRYAPVKGIVLSQLFHYNYLYDHQTRVAKKLRTYRLLDVGRSELYTTDTRIIEHILKTNFANYGKGKSTHEIFQDLFGDGIFSVDGNMWRQQRKLASYEFSAKKLRDFSCSVFKRNAARLVRDVSGLSVSGREIELQDMLMKYAMESIVKVGFGVDLNCMILSSEIDEGMAFMKALDDAIQSVNFRYIDPLWKLKRLLNIGSEASLKRNIKIIDNIVYNVLRTKRKQLALNPDLNVKEDILSRFLAEEEKNPETMTDKYLRDIICNFMIAGKDTTANTLCWFFYMLCKNPSVQEKVAEEVMDVVIASGETDCANVDDFLATITDETLQKMQYLHAALTETLRLYPVAPTDGRCALEDDILPDGHRINKGEEISYLAYAMGRMPYIWGEDAEVFRPERWLKNGVFQPESPFKFISFHAGPRICLGKEFAYRQMKIFSIALLRCFRFELADDTKDAVYEITFTLHMKGGLHLRAIPRT